MISHISFRRDSSMDDSRQSAMYQSECTVRDARCKFAPKLLCTKRFLRSKTHLQGPENTKTKRIILQFIKWSIFLLKHSVCTLFWTVLAYISWIIHFAPAPKKVAPIKEKLFAKIHHCGLAPENSCTCVQIRTINFIIQLQSLSNKRKFVCVCVCV